MLSNQDANLSYLMHGISERICEFMRPLPDILPSTDRDHFEVLLGGLLRGGCARYAAEWSARRALVYKIVDDARRLIFEVLYETWHPDELPTLARFVLPTAPQVEEVLDAARQLLQDGAATVCGTKLATAVFEELTRRRIMYDHEPLSLGPAQRVRLPHKIFKRNTAKAATCLDLALLWAGCIEAGHGEPIVFQFVHKSGSAHALAGLWLQPPIRREVVYRDASPFVLSGRSANVLVVETTAVAVNQRKVYQTACRAARAMFTEPDWRLRFAVDIGEARQRGIKPWHYIGD